MEPISLAEAKDHLRIIDDNSQDSVIDSLIKASRIHVEGLSGYSLVTQTWKVQFDKWPCEYLQLPRRPIQSVTSVKYRGTDEVLVTVSPSVYVFQRSSGRIYLGYSQVWPNAVLSPAYPVEVEMVAGYGDTGADVPSTLRQAILVALADLHANPEGDPKSALSAGAQRVVKMLAKKNYSQAR